MATAAGFYLSVPVYGSVNPIIMQLADASTMTEAQMDAEIAGMEAFVMAGYEDAETVYATLYQIAPNGGLVTSECYPISGPEAQ
jgi:hypothetical protein